MSWPSVTIAVLAFNRRDALDRALAHTVGEAEYPGDVRVVVVDNGSTDGTEAMLRERYPRVEVIRLEDNRGVPAWNEAFAVATSDYVLVLDDDCYLEPGGLARAVTEAERRDAGLVSLRVVAEADRNYAFTDEYRTGLLTFWGCAALIRRDALEAAGPFDPGIFIWAHELDFTMRLLDRGFRHLYLQEVTAVHMKAPGNDAFVERPYRVNARHWGYIAGRRLRLRDVPPVLGNLCAQSALWGVRWDRRAFKALPDVLRGGAGGLRRRDPVRAEVSSLYRRRFRDFAGPWPLLRTPADRLRRGAGSRQKAQRRRHDQFFDERFYPTKNGELVVFPVRND